MSEQNTALITGASSGIGKEFAKIHAQKKGNLVLVARSTDKLEVLKKELEEKHNISVLVITEDLSQTGAAQSVFEKTQSQNIQIDILINNAGFGGHGLFHEQALENHQNMMQVNMASLTELTYLYLPGMIERKQGKILNVSSTASFMPGPLQAVYYASKAYVTSFTQAVAEEVCRFNITVTALCPGTVATDFVKTGNLEGLTLWKFARSAESVAAFCYKAMEKGKLVVINEPILSFALNYLVPWVPRKLLLKISRKTMEKSN